MTLKDLYLKKGFWIYSTVFFCVLFFLLDELFLYGLSFFPSENQLAVHRTALFLIVAAFILWTQFSLFRIVVMNQQLIHAAKLSTLGEMAAMVSHELIRPLTNIDLKLQLNLQQADTTPEMKNFSREIMADLDRGKSILDSLRSFGKKSNSSAKNKQNINGIIKDTLELTKPYISFTAIKTELGGSLSPVNCNPTQIEQVFSNLLINAKDSLPKNANEGIEIRSFSQGNNIIVEIEDAGGGIPKSDLRKLFDPFFTTKGEEEGTGLGLAISQRIIKEHDGELSVKSRPGQTIFKISLPALLN